MQANDDKTSPLNMYLDTIVGSVRKGFKNRSKFENVIANRRSYRSVDLQFDQTPEEFTKEKIIEPLFAFLGFTEARETRLPVPEGAREPDYVITTDEDKGLLIYVEAEPINTDLFSKGHGARQVNQWLLSKASKSRYGLATDGISWNLLRFDEATNKVKTVLSVDLRDTFIRKANPHAFVTDQESQEIIEKFMIFDSKSLRGYIEDFETREEEVKEEISLRFYNDYVEHVFGITSKGRPTNRSSLVKSIISPDTSSDEDAALFAVVFMNRLIFITFLEDRQIVRRNLLSGLLASYREGKPLQSFYQTYLKPLFYEVFNKGKSERRDFVRHDRIYNEIPYLNGGLFNEVVSREADYDIENEGIEVVIEEILGKYTIGLNSDANIRPEILGYIFEKTINYVSGVGGTNQQKMLGAYYTPDDVVSFILNKTLSKTIFDKMVRGLRNAGWTETDLAGLRSTEDILENMPRNRKHSQEMLRTLEGIKICDPACGSGHFLTAVLSELVRVEASIILAMGREPDLYDLKRRAVSKNLYGVDIDGIAVEITKLRLWLSIIEEVSDPVNVETLPNIDFNILTGNSLVGYLDEPLSISLVQTSENEDIISSIRSLRDHYGDKIDEVVILFQDLRIESVMQAYERLVSMYYSETGQKAVAIRRILEKARSGIYASVDLSYLAFLSNSSDIGRDNVAMISRLIKEKPTFHWTVDFREIIAGGGFDAVIGNPPYIEDANYDESELEILRCNKREDSGTPLMYLSSKCGNTHAYFTERSIKLLKNGGRFGFIVPISLVSTDRMEPIRRFVHDNSALSEYYNFDDRPGKIFSGLEHCRSTIVISTKGSPSGEIVTSKYHRWKSADRSRLFGELCTVDYKSSDGKLIPKLGSPIEKRILLKLVERSSGKTVRDYLSSDGVKIWYHNAPQYWIHAHTTDHLPQLEEFRHFTRDDRSKETVLQGEPTKRVSDQYKKLTLLEKDSLWLICLLNSSVFYWWYIIWSDGRHLLDQHISSFPIELDAVKQEQQEETARLINSLMVSYDENANVKVNIRQGGYAIKLKEIIPKRSYDVIKAIDSHLLAYLGLDSEERAFIQGFDLAFRLGNE